MTPVFFFLSISPMNQRQQDSKSKPQEEEHQENQGVHKAEASAAYHSGVCIMHSQKVCVIINIITQHKKSKWNVFRHQSVSATTSKRVTTSPGDCSLCSYCIVLSFSRQVFVISGYVHDMQSLDQSSLPVAGARLPFAVMGLPLAVVFLLII